MKPPPAPLTRSGLSERCHDILGKNLILRCAPGWGWSHHVGEQSFPFQDEVLVAGHVHLLAQGFVEFTTPCSGIYGAVTSAPQPYSLQRFVAFTMSDGCDYDFTENIAPAWRIMLGQGDLDYESEWFPILKGQNVYFGYGSIGLDKHFLDLSESRRRMML
ncbi:MAG: hypothetical protein L0219_17150 [Phycisphaerales bacterium]|nr:hypothetical protein [Phycisphaerales bacterium]